MMQTIFGEAVLDFVPVPIAGATLLLRIEDSSRADAPAMIVMEHRISGISRPAGNTDPLQFALSLPVAPPKGGPGWNLRVTLSQDPGGRLQPGDYASVRRYPLHRLSPDGHLRIVLQRLA